MLAVLAAEIVTSIAALALSLDDFIIEALLNLLTLAIDPSEALFADTLLLAFPSTGIISSAIAVVTNDLSLCMITAMHNRLATAVYSRHALLAYTNLTTGLRAGGIIFAQAIRCALQLDNLLSGALLNQLALLIDFGESRLTDANLFAVRTQSTDASGTGRLHDFVRVTGQDGLANLIDECKSRGTNTALLTVSFTITSAALAV